jgi:hypothetical protein
MTIHALSSPSLIDGWVPLSVEVVTGLALIRAIRWRSRRWQLVLLPVLGAVGIAAAALAHWALRMLGWAGEPAPWQLWFWVGLSALAVGVAAAGWPGANWTRRNLGVFAVSFLPAEHWADRQRLDRVHPDRRRRLEPGDGRTATR